MSFCSDAPHQESIRGHNEYTHSSDFTTPREPTVLLERSSNLSFWIMAWPTVGRNLRTNFCHLPPPSCQMSLRRHGKLSNPCFYLSNFWHSWFLEAVAS